MSFVVELKAPLRREAYAAYLNKIKPLIEQTKCISLPSKPSETSSGFEQNHQFANYLRQELAADGKDLDIIFHLTCRDLNRDNIEARLKLLEKLQIEKVLIVSGDNYSPPPQNSTDGRVVNYANSSELVKHILSNFKSLFKSVAVAGYPGGNGRESHNNQQECDRLRDKLVAGSDTIYTQCVFDWRSFSQFRQNIEQEFGNQIRVIPSVAIFKDAAGLRRISRLARVDVNWSHVVQQLSTDDKCQEALARAYLVKLCSDLQTNCRSLLAIDLCTFGQLEFTQNIIDEVRDTRGTKAS